MGTVDGGGSRPRPIRGELPFTRQAALILSHPQRRRSVVLAAVNPLSAWDRSLIRGRAGESIVCNLICNILGVCEVCRSSRVPWVSGCSLMYGF